MVALPRPQSQVPALIYAAYEARNEAWDSLGFSPSALGTDCDRALWYLVRWAAPGETFDGRQLRLFQSGHIGEERMIADLRDAGLEVYDTDTDGKQFRARALAGHVRGKLDGIAKGVPEAPTKWHVVEIKTANAKNFAAIKKHGIAKAKPEYFIQANIYMGIRGIDRCLFCVASKDNDEIYVERFPFDHDAFTKLLARLERILRADEPPQRITDKPDAFACRWCKAKPVCWDGSFARLSCRTCLHVSADFSGDAAWACSRWQKPLSFDEQHSGCPAHLFNPGLVPGEITDTDEQRELVTYLLNDGRVWIDGQDRVDEPVAAKTTLEDAA